MRDVDSITIPRLVVGGVSSGVGKTTVVVALTRALEARGLRVAPFKCGPDYLDPTYHARAARRVSPNLDGWMMGRDGVLATFARASRGADIAIVEGVMGLFDGASPTDDAGSTAEIATWLASPVVAVVDASAMARTIAAIAKGLATFDADLRLEGVVANRVGGRGHLDLLRAACSGSASPPVLGGLPSDASMSFAERHLGLVTARAESSDDGRLEQAMGRWGALAADWLAIEDLLALARTAPPLALGTVPRDASPVTARCRIGVAHDEALHFYYDDNLARLEAHGATLVRFSPVNDAHLPDVDGLYLGGGYPEVHAAAIAKNGSMRASIKAFADRGAPIYAECGGLMLLVSALRTADGLFPMAGVLDGVVTMHDRLQALGYVEVETRRASILGPAGTRFRGHQFRYSEYPSTGDPASRLYSVRRWHAGDTVAEGFTRGSVVASYVHAHWASNPAIAEALVEACAAFRCT